jgi:hypothetical protein
VTIFFEGIEGGGISSSESFSGPKKSSSSLLIIFVMIGFGLATGFGFDLGDSEVFGF